ncbi:isochorismatase family cysteine hydrolase [Amycolatopsis sp. SID8362]|uniref:cysteine hydrolase family protein n=1 Tax=Amycolatopsis sp. SID8362 TaxID=2690346 RepID=UPI001370C472|nr:isochorismatase family cysteine hydrolase [Amycolatopsis sp. SID8362]NBH07424.1 isochorismatase family protein [Amycolatopsis sp. SID8362]NED44120.1 cysteine hydrolase [Amycolatopsis sp. SID8362]
MRALLVVDMQNGFCHPRGSVPAMLGPMEGVATAIAGCVAAVAAARAAGVPVVYTRHCYRPGYVDAGANFERLGAGIRDSGGLLRGSWDAEVLDELAPAGGDVVVDKTRYDAFFATDLELVLRGAGVTDLIVCGVATNVCVASSVRTAYAADFGVTVVPEACAGWTTALHEAALKVLAESMFADVRSVRECFTPR